jgi:rfaE bifunctional protein nucleotidyltransferase chain/domain
MNRLLAMDSFTDAVRVKYIAPEHLEEKARELKERGKTLVTLNGSFDLLHAGHLQILYQASLQGDFLIVALNTDRSIQCYKSPQRPLIPLEYRLQMMAALEMVDYVTWFDETDPREMLKKVRPHVHVNGAEYGENCLEAEVVRSQGGRIHIVELVPGLSTSQIIQKIQSLCD